MKKIIYVCDRCDKEIKITEAKCIAINSLDEDGLILDNTNPFEEFHYCEKCAHEIVEFICRKGIKVETKRRGRPPKKEIYSKNAKAMLAKGE